MKIAIVISGQPRNVEKTFFTGIKNNVLDCNAQHDIDVFVHTWLSKDDIGNGHLSAQDSIYNRSSTASDVVSQNIIGDIYNLYFPKKILVEEQIDFDIKGYNENKTDDNKFINPLFSLSKMYSTKRANALKMEYERENGFVYDMQLSTRFDISFDSKIIFDDADGSAINTIPTNPGAVDVTFSFSNSNVGNIWATLFDNIEEYFYKDKILFCDEWLMYRHLVKNNIKINTLKDFHRHIVRKDGFNY